MRFAALLAVLLLQQVAALRSDYDGDFECPVPNNPELTTAETCSQYTACRWVEGRCVLVSAAKQGYVYAEDPVETTGGIKAKISKADESVTMYGDDIKTLQFEAIYHEADHLQIKITDPGSARYEVPIAGHYAGSLHPEGRHYTVLSAPAGQPFRMAVTRPHALGQPATHVLEQVGPFTYEDQFIEFSVKLNTKYLYGFGENPHLELTHTFEPRKTYPMFARDQPIGEEDTAHYGVYPYYVNIEDDAGNTHSVLLMNSNAMEYSTFLLSDGSPALTLRTIGGVIDLHVFLGPTPELVNQQYAQFVGRPQLPPYWALGFQLSRWGYGSTGAVREMRQRMRDAAVPQDVQYFDIDYMDARRDFTYDPNNFQDLPELIEELKLENIKTVLILDPAIPIDTVDYTPFSNGLEYDAYIQWSRDSDVPADQPPAAGRAVVGNVWPDSRTVFPDFMRGGARRWWGREVAGLHEKLAFDGIWIDMNEPANFDTNLYDWGHLNCPTDNKLEMPPYPTKVSWYDNNPSKRISDKTLCMSALQTDDNKTYHHYDVHSLYGYFESIATNEALRALQPGKRPFVLSRSSYPGSGAYAAHWLGDNSASWTQMAMSVVGMMEMNMFGVPMVGADICGFFSVPSEELCARWMQLGAFYPFSRNHNTLEEPDQDPAVWPVVAEVSAKVLSIRYRYLPYLYTLLQEAHSEGSSVVRPLFNAFPEDVACREVRDQFLWGGALMVAPVLTEGATARRVYVPTAVWYDVISGERRFENVSSKSVEVAAPLDTIPLYFRGGSILPLQEPALNTEDSRQNPFGLLVAPDEDGKAYGTVYWDDGGSDVPLREAFYARMYFFKVADTTDALQVDPVYTNQVDGMAWETIRVLGVSEEPTSINLDNGPEPGFSYDKEKEFLDITLNFPMKGNLYLEIVY